MNRIAEVVGIALITAPLMIAGNAHAKKQNDKDDSRSSGKKCLPEVGALFDPETNTVSAESTKELSNIVLLFSDGTTERFEGLSGKTGEFTGTGDNNDKILTGVWIKSGCNASGDGPGYGEFIENGTDFVTVPVIGIGDAPGIIEPGFIAEIAEVHFEVSLSERVPLDGDSVLVDFATRDGTAVAYEDYFPVSGTLIFEPGTITQTIIVLVVDDSVAEPYEYFHVDLSNPRNALVATVTGTGEIIDDDGDF